MNAISATGSRRLLVCGGRDLSDPDLVYQALDMVHERKPIALVIHGGARGADTLAGEWAALRRIPVCVFPANWEHDGKGAGPIRNAAMLAHGMPSAVVAFPGGNGTADMVRRCLEAGLPVWQPTRRADTFYVILTYEDEGFAELAAHAALNPGTLSIEDIEGNVLWSPQ